MPTTYSYPGVYVEEIQPLSRPIAGVSTSTAGFIGVAADDTSMPETPKSTKDKKDYYPIYPANKPKLLTSWEEFRQSFGDASSGNKYLALAVYGFFNNGGTRCYVARIESVSTNEIKACLAEFEAIDEISIVAAPLRPEKEEISAADEALQKATAVTQALEEAVKSAEKAKEIATREFEDAKKAEAAAKFEFDKAGLWEGKKRTDSTAADTAAGGIQDPKAPEVIKAKEAKQDLQVATTDKTAKEGIFTRATTARMAAEKVATDADSTLEKAKAAKDNYKPSTPPSSTATTSPPPWPFNDIYISLIEHCLKMKDRVAILDSSRDATPDTVKIGFPISEEGYAAFYFPWIQVADPTVTNGKVFVPPSGAIAGIYARTDSERGVHKAPANESVRGALGLAYQVTRAQQEGLNPSGVNCIRNFYGSILVWGGRTLAVNGPKKEWTYVNVRRFMNFLRESIEQNLRWVVFEPNDPGLWQRIVRTVSDFLLTQWRAGALFGETPKQAFFVRCDSSTNPPELRELGQVVTEIGVAVVKPAEFVIFRIQQQTGG